MADGVRCGRIAAAGITDHVSPMYLGIHMQHIYQMAVPIFGVGTKKLLGHASVTTTQY